MAESDNTFHPSVDNNTAPFQPFDFAGEGKLVPKYTPKYDTYTTDRTNLFPNPSPNPLLGVVAPPTEEDPVNHPSHYTSHPSGIECIEITWHMGFNLGNVFKYVWRCDLKRDAIEDLEKAAFYLADEIALRKKAAGITE